MKTNPSRRRFLKSFTTACAGARLGAPSFNTFGSPLISPLLVPDHQALLARSEIVYRVPASRPGEGLPIGNGRMGTMVWTAGDSLCFQINRVDNFTANRFHHGVYKGPTDLLLSLAGFRIHLGQPSFAKSKRFVQKLSLYNGEASLRAETEAGKIEATALVNAEDDVLLVRLNDQREPDQDVEAELWLWRPPEIKNGPQTLHYTIGERDGRILLSHECHEGEFTSRYAVAVGVEGRRARVELAGDQEARLIIPAGRGPFTIQLASASALDRMTDVDGQALESLDRAEKAGWDTLNANHRSWWHSFWKKSFVYLRSDDGTADYLERMWNLHLYLMGSSSRGKFVPKFNGSIWINQEDQRNWGAQFWVWNTESDYFHLYAANHIELANPLFKMYWAQLPNARRAAVERWGVGGAHYPETTPFDGPRELTAAIAAEFRDVHFGRKTRDQLSEAAREAGCYDASLAVLVVTKEKFVAKGRYVWISHILSSGSELAMHFWWRWQYTQDRRWLAERAYPMMKACAQFYLEYFKPGRDGRLHIYPCNCHESFWGVHDSIMDLAAVRALFPALVRASEILGVDQELRSRWRDFLAKLAPYPMGNELAARELGGSLGPGRWAAGLLGDVPGMHNHEMVWLTPVFPFGAVTLAHHDAHEWKVAESTYEALPHRLALFKGEPIPGWSRLGVLAARMGRAEDIRTLLPAFAAQTQPFPNGLTTEDKHDPNMTYPESLGLISAALQEAMLQSMDGVLQVFPAWPSVWDARFQLRACGGFLVSASQRNGATEFIEIESLAGEPCQVRNPWPGPVFIYRNGVASEKLQGNLLRLSTKKGERLALLPKRVSLSSLRVEIKPRATRGIARLKAKLPNGRILKAQWGK